MNDKSESIHIRVTQPVKTLIKNKAEARGMSVSKHVLDVLKREMSGDLVDCEKLDNLINTIKGKFLNDDI